MTDASILSGAVFYDMVRGGAARLYSDRAAVNDLNVFPVPDGDTGDNMYMTIHSGSVASDGTGSLGQVSAQIAHGMLLGARGNSGVILSRIFAGIAKGFEGKESADAETVRAALQSGVAQAYGAVSNPVEGTILTVFREAAEYAVGRVTDKTPISGGLELLYEEASRSLERTPELLDTLKEANVVDSGGAGLVSIIEGMIRAVGGEVGEVPEEAGTDGKEPLDLSLFTEDSVLEYGYCTEFLLRLQRSKGDPERFDIDAFKNHLDEIGDSVVAFRDGTIVKAHVHSKTPSEILEYGQRFGEFLTLKIENMTLQHHGVREREANKAKKPRKKYAVVTVASGEGIRKTFLSMGADAVIDGGQCMNPSVSDFVGAFREINADTILVFPGNSNIILTANQAAGMYDDAEICVIPCKSISETYAALSVLDTSSGNTEEILRSVTEELSAVVSACVSRANRDAEMNGVAVRAGDFIGYGGGKILSDDADRATAACLLAERLGAGEYGVMLLICGADTSGEETAHLYETLSEKYRHTEIIMIDGGQPVQDYIIMLE